MNIEDLSIFGLYSQKENKVTTALLQVLECGGATLLHYVLSKLCLKNQHHFFQLPLILLSNHRLRCRAPVFQLLTRVAI